MNAAWEKAGLTGGHEAGWLVAGHGQHRPLQRREGLQAGCERGVILRREPATSPGPATGELAPAPALRLAACGSQAIQSEAHAALGRGDLRQTVPGRPLVAGQE